MHDSIQNEKNTISLPLVLASSKSHKMKPSKFCTQITDKIYLKLDLKVYFKCVLACSYSTKCDALDTVGV